MVSAFLVAVLGVALEQVPDPLPPLTTAQSAREWAFPAGANRPVKLTGVVTHANPQYPDFFLQDDTAGIYIGDTPLAKGVARGDRVEVEGTVEPGTFAPFVKAASIKVVGKGPLPDPEPFNLRAEESRWLDGQYVQTYAFVRGSGTSKHFAWLTVITSEGAGRVLVPGPENHDALAKFVGSTVRVRGVCVPSHDDESKQIRGRTFIYVQTPSLVKAIGGLQPRLAPLPIERHLKGFTATPHPTARPIALEGVAIASFSDHEVVLQDETGGAHVVFADAPDPSAVQPGRKIVVHGFLNPTRARVVIDNASLVESHPGVPPAPISPTVPIVTRETFGRLVTVEGVVENAVMRDEYFTVNLRNGPERFRVLFRGDPPAEVLERCVPDARVSVTGAAILLPRGISETEIPAILARTADDVVLLASPPVPMWWTPAKLSAVFAGAAVAFLLVALWVWLLQRQVRKQTEVITQNFEREAKLNESLRQAKKLEAVGRLAGGIAHDFNNLLTVIIGNSELAAQTLRPGDPARELVTTACDAAEKAAAITRQLLTFSRQGPAQLEPIDLNAALKDIDKLLQRMIGSNITLTMDYWPGLPAVMGDATLIHQIVFNLAANARDAMPQGGKLTIRTSLDRDDSGAPSVRLTVTDTGCGMDEATIGRAFEPFFTTKDVGKGTGLGLATVYGTLATLNGKIRIDSTVGGGTTFLIDLPPLLTEPDSAASPSQEIAARAARILIVDDENAVREVCRLTLSMYGYTVLAASSGKEAMEIFETDGDSIDLVVSDLVMPGMNGQELGVALRAKKPALPILFVSGYPEEEVALFLDGLTNVQILNKPFTPLHLAIKVQDILEELSRQPQTQFRMGKPTRLPE